MFRWYPLQTRNPGLKKRDLGHHSFPEDCRSRFNDALQPARLSLKESRAFALQQNATSVVTPDAATTRAKQRKFHTAGPQNTHSASRNFHKNSFTISHLHTYVIAHRCDSAVASLAQIVTLNRTPTLNRRNDVSHRRE